MRRSKEEAAFETAKHDQKAWVGVDCGFESDLHIKAAG